MRYNVVTDKNDINFQCFTTSFPFSTLSFYFLEILPSSFSSVNYHFAIDENHLPGANLFCIIGNVCCILCSKLIKMKRYFLKKLSNYLPSQLICFWIRTIPFLPLGCIICIYNIILNSIVRASSSFPIWTAYVPSHQVFLLLVMLLISVKVKILLVAFRPIVPSITTFFWISIRMVSSPLRPHSLTLKFEAFGFFSARLSSASQFEIVSRLLCSCSYSLLLLFSAALTAIYSAIYFNHFFIFYPYSSLGE